MAVRSPINVIRERRKLDAKLIGLAKQEALEKVHQGLAELAELGFSFELTEKENTDERT